MIRGFLTICGLVSAAALTLAACSGGGSSATSTPRVSPPTATSAPTATANTMGSAIFAVRDAAADMGAVTGVRIAVDSVRVHNQAGAWTTVSSQSQTYDLLVLRGKGIAELLAETKLAAGSYDQMELTISTVTVTDDKGQHEAKLPSGKLQLQGSLEVKAGTTSTASFDFLADQSLHTTGDGLYILAPVVRVETRAEADAQVTATREVKMGGGRVTTDAEIGMNAEGDVDAGLRVSPDAILRVDGNGKVVQSAGHAVAAGTIKAVDALNNGITVMTKGGSDLALQVAADSNLKVAGSETTLANLAAQVGAQVTVQYNAETKAVSRLVAGTDGKARAQAATVLDIRGTIKSVDAAKGTVTIIADSGASVVVKVASDGEIRLGGAKVSVSGLGARIGSRVETELNASRGAASTVDADTEASVNASGQIKAVDVGNGTITLTNQAGQETTLSLDSDSKVMVNGSLVTLGQLRSMVGSAVTVENGQDSKAADGAGKPTDARGQVTTTVAGTVKSIDAAAGTVTITANTGTDVVLKIGANSQILVGSSVATLADLAARTGAQVMAQYDGKTNELVRFEAGVQAQGQAGAPGTTTAAGSGSVSTGSTGSASGTPAAGSPDSARPAGTATVAGVLKMVNAASGTITVAAEGGQDVVLKLAVDTRVVVNGSASSVATLVAQVGSSVTVEYNVETKTTVSISATGQATGVAGKVLG